jgi:hypothetical protein
VQVARRVDKARAAEFANRLVADFGVRDLQRIGARDVI